MLICPICKTPLVREDSRYVCEKSHSHDISKYGHVNLLMSQKGGNHGDSREMLLARKRFLEGGHYSAMREELAKTVLSCLGEQSSVTLVDSGCGECYYTERVRALLIKSGKETLTIGIDISKDALRIASQRFGADCKAQNASVLLSVASSYDLPIKKCSADVVISVFAPLCSEEFYRILTEKGVFITVIPGKRHLWELKKAIYEIPYENEIQPYEINGFELITKKEVSGTFSLESASDIADLFTMTPYFCRTSESDRKKLSSLSHLDCSYEFEILAYRKI